MGSKLPFAASGANGSFGPEADLVDIARNGGFVCRGGTRRRRMSAAEPFLGIQSPQTL